MLAAIIILSIAVVGLILYCTACIMHIKRIQEELAALAEEQSIQNQDIIRLSEQHHLITEILMTEQQREFRNTYWITGPGGEA